MPEYSSTASRGVIAGDTSPSATTEAHQNDHQRDGDYYLAESSPLQPILPSQLLESYRLMQPPPHMPGEDVPIAGQFQFQFQPAGYATIQPSSFTSDSAFATVANDMINKKLGRKPGGTSVVEPDSVLGESGRLYHGYKEGSYFLPNDAVCSSVTIQEQELMK